MSLAGIAIAIDDTLLIGLGRAKAAALERAIACASGVTNEALVAELIGWTDLAICMILDGAARIDRIAGALQALGAILWEDQTVAALIRCADETLQLIVARFQCAVVQFAGAATNRISI